MIQINLKPKTTNAIKFIKAQDKKKTSKTNSLFLTVKNDKDITNITAKYTPNKVLEPFTKPNCGKKSGQGNNLKVKSKKYNALKVPPNKNKYTAPKI